MLVRCEHFFTVCFVICTDAQGQLATTHSDPVRTPGSCVHNPTTTSTTARRLDDRENYHIITENNMIKTGIQWKIKNLLII